MLKQVRKCSGAVVWRYRGATVEVLLVKSTSGRKWVFPKGGIEPNLSAQQNAVKECWEEAGVIGHIGDCISMYSFEKDGVKQHVTMFAMECIAELTVYPESEIRERKWVAVGEAEKLLGRQLRDVLDTWLDIGLAA